MILVLHALLIMLDLAGRAPKLQRKLAREIARGMREAEDKARERMTVRWGEG